MPKPSQNLISTEWKEKDIQLAWEPSGAKVIRGRCYKVFGVHRFVGPGAKVDPKLWAVTSLTTGYLVTKVDNELAAIRISEYLWQKCRIAFQEATVSGIRIKIQRWAMDWLKECREAGKYLSPQPYIEEYRNAQTS